MAARGAEGGRQLVKKEEIVEVFRFEGAKARAELAAADGALWPVNSFSDADELNALLEATLRCGAILAIWSEARLHVYPLSVSEPTPLLAVAPSEGPAIVGFALDLRERDGEDPVEFTLRLLRDAVAAANALLLRRTARPAGRGHPPLAPETRYAFALVLEAESPGRACQSLVERLMVDPELRCVYLSAPCCGLPAELAELRLRRLGFEIEVIGEPNATRDLRPCD
jgi:hypothetical protein